MPEKEAGSYPGGRVWGASPLAEIFSQHTAGVLVVVAVAAEILPVAAVWRVVVVVAVTVMHGQQVDAGAIELAAALGANRAVDLQRFCAVVAVAVHLAPHPLYEGGGFCGAGEGHCPGASGFHQWYPVDSGDLLTTTVQKNIDVPGVPMKRITRAATHKQIAG
jgi:hypothetical protein